MKNRESKRNLVTVRLTDAESDSLDYLAINHDRTKSDVILRACKLYLTMGESCEAGMDDEKKTKKPVRVHVRMSDADMDDIREHGNKTGETISEVIRRAVKAFCDMSRTHY